ncbi:MAG: hypothetical protein ABI988_16365 [Nitrospirota bacterium]
MRRGSGVKELAFGGYARLVLGQDKDVELVGRVLTRLMPFRRMATRDDGLARNCVSLLPLVWYAPTSGRYIPL